LKFQIFSQILCKRWKKERIFLLTFYFGISSYTVENQSIEKYKQSIEIAVSTT